MKTIRIIRGTYGKQKPNSSGVVPKSPDDLPFEIDDSEAERLVGLGVAEYCTSDPDTSDTPSGENSEGKSNIGATLTLPQLGRLNKPTLEALAKGRGLDLSAATNNSGRAQIIWEDLEKAHLAVAEVEKGVYEIVEDNENSAGDEGNDGAGDGKTDDEGTDGEDNENSAGDEGNDGAGDEPPPTVGAEAPVD